jgi:hypothetical protein
LRTPSGRPAKVILQREIELGGDIVPADRAVGRGFLGELSWADKGIDTGDAFPLAQMGGVAGKLSGPAIF